MRKNKLLFLLAGIGLLSSSFSLTLVNSINVKSAYASSYTINTVPTTIDLNDSSEADIRKYYSSLNALSTSERQGTNLLKNLKPILKNGQKYFSYGSGATTAVWKAYEIIDRDWELSPATDISGYNALTNKITGYSYGSSASKPGSNPYIHSLYVNRDKANGARAWSDHSQTNYGFNQEHIWAKSCGFEDDKYPAGARGDLMHLWAGNGRVNGQYHKNYYYGYVDTSRSYSNAGSDYAYLDGNLKGYSTTLGGSTTVFEPQDSDKGDIARAIFYMAARYNYLSGSDSDGIDSGNPNLEIVNNVSTWQNNGYTCSTTTTGKMGILQDLLEWNRLDPPDEWEIHRNNLLYKNFTNNRNPFIDFPEWAEYIWGSSSGGSYSSTSTGYAKANSDTINDFNGDEPVTGVSLNKNSTSIVVWKTETLSASVSPNNASNKSVSWTSSDPTVATVSSLGVVSALKAGNTRITVTTEDGSFTAYCDVTVIEEISGSTVATNYTGALTEGDYVIYYSGKAMANSVSSGRLSYQEVSLTDGVIVDPDEDIIWHIAPSGDYWTIYNEDVSKYAASTGGDNKGQLLASGSDDKSLWSCTSSVLSTTYDFVNKYNTENDKNAYLRNNGTYGFATYSTNTGSALYLYKVGVGEDLEVTSISAVANHDFAIGDTITKSDITVTDNLGNEINDFTMSDNGYQFTYNDAPSGGSINSKTFTITYNELETTVDIDIQREEYVCNYDKLTNSTAGIGTGTSYTNWSNKTVTTDAVYAGQSAGKYTTIQLQSSKGTAGIISTTSGGLLSKVVVDWNENTLTGRTLNVYGSDSAYSSAADLYSEATWGTLLGTIVKGTSTELDIEGDYSFIGLRSNADAMYLNSVYVVYQTEEVEYNFANYLMYEDTNNQCISKLDTAIEIFNTLTSEEKEAYMDSTNYVIEASRNRFEAWLAHQNRSLDYVNDKYVITNNVNINPYIETDDNLKITIIIISTSSLLLLLTFMCYKGKKKA